MNRMCRPDGRLGLVSWAAAATLLAPGCGVLTWQSPSESSHEATRFGRSELGPLAALAAAGEAQGASEEAGPQTEKASQEPGKPSLPVDAAPADRQAQTEPEPTRRRVESAGPRVGLVVVTGNDAEKLEDELDVVPVLTLVGWQFEYQYAAAEFGPVGLVDIVALVAGMEQSQFLPTVNVLVGMRMVSDWEFGVGLNLSPGENVVGLTAAVGKTFWSDGMGLPVNFAVVSMKDSMRVSFTVGWNLRQ